VTHNIKCWPGPFRLTAMGLKKFEWRKNDRNYRVGDRLTLMEWDPKKKTYTGQAIDLKVVCILHGGEFDIPKGYCIMGVE
jgi:hypothetical protein